MKRFLFVFPIVVGPCLGGCMLPPMTAKEMFAVSNPTAIVKFPRYGTMEIPTNAKIRLKIEDNPDGTGKVDFTMASDAGAVVGEEGERLIGMEGQRNAYTAGQVETTLAATQMMSGVFRDVMELAKVALPLLARPSTPEPPSQPSPVLEEILRRLPTGPPPP